MEQTPVKREPLRETRDVFQNAAVPNTTSTKQEPTELSALHAIPEMREPSLPSPLSASRPQAHSQHQQEQLQQQYLKQERERHLQQQPEQIPGPASSIIAQHDTPLNAKQEPREAITPASQNIKPEAASSSQSLARVPVRTPTPMKLCFTCATPTTMARGACRLCYRAFYCSPECQAMDWPRHHGYCTAGLPDPLSSNSILGYGSQHSPVMVSSDRDDHDSEYDESSDEDAAMWTIQDNSEDTRKIIELFASLPDIDVPPGSRKKAPRAMSCALLPHQRVGLTWLMEQENSTRRGGILADTMGLGKTIQALALILAHPSKDSAYKTTLIVAPLALLRQWEREIEDKLKPAYKLKTIIVHGQKKKSMTVARLLSYDVVLTTYGTVAAEHKPRKNAKTKKLILATRFHRIILDEAHNIKNHRSQAAQAVTSIRATYRLCMTGTPLMNNVRELYSLVKFLRISPYDDWKKFYESFDKPMRGNKWAQSSAMRALQAFLRTILLQRTATSQIDGKQILNLPELISGTAVAKFNEEQQEVYDHLEHQMWLKFNKYLKAGTVLKNYSYILVLILRLRQCCCHPYLFMNHGIPEGAQLKPDEMIELAAKLDDQVVERIKAQSQFQCPLCDQTVENPVIIYPCGHHLCGECFTGLMLVRDADCNGYDEDPPFPSCPTGICSEVVDPERIICHSYFIEAYMSTSSAGESADEDSESDEKDLIEDDDEADEDGNLKDFIVADNDEGSPDNEEDQDDKYEYSIEDSRSSRLDRDRLNPVHSDGNPGLSEGDDNGDGIKAEVVESTSYQEEKREDAGSDSDDSLPELGVMWKRADERRLLSTPQNRVLPFKRTAKTGLDSSPIKPKLEADDLDLFRHSGDFFQRQPSQSASRTTKSALKSELESDDEFRDHRSKRQHIANSNYSSSTGRIREPDDIKTEDETAVGSRKRKRSKGKAIAKPKERAGQQPKKSARKKKKSNFTSLADLKAESNKNAAAKQRYIRRLRKEYESSAKIDRTMELLREIREKNPNEKTLIFSVFTSFLDLLEIPIQDEGYVYRRYDGSMPHEAREVAVDDFMKKPDVKIMLISLKAGNAGLNLQQATQVIILDPFWNPSVEDQAVGRAHRLGQKNPVTVYKVLIEGTVEDRIVALQEKKRALVNEVLNSEAARSLGRLTVNELASLFGIGVNGQRSRRR